MGERAYKYHLECSPKAWWKNENYEPGRGRKKESKKMSWILSSIGKKQEAKSKIKIASNFYFYENIRLLSRIKKK